MTDLPTIALAVVVGLQFGCITSWRYYRRQRDEYDNASRQHRARIDAMERDLDRERLERRRAEDEARLACGPYGRWR
jgi:hypothetical protein